MTRAFSGLSAFPVTPMDAGGRVDTDHLQRVVARLAGAGVQSIGVLGSTGAYAYLSSAERARAVRAAVEAAGAVPVLAGIGALATRDVIRHAQDSEAAGASAVLLAPMSYLPLTEADVVGLFEDATGATGLPVCVYNNPGTTHVTISDDLLVRLAAIPGVVAVKSPSAADVPAQLARLRPQVPEGFSLGHSGDATMAGALNAGCDAWYSVLAGACPEICMDMWAARNHPGALAEIDARLAPLWSLFAQHGGIRVIYEAANILGLGPVALPRPLLPLPDAVRTQIAAALRAANENEGEAA